MEKEPTDFHSLWEISALSYYSVNDSLVSRISRCATSNHPFLWLALLLKVALLKAYLIHLFFLAVSFFGKN